MNDNLNLLVTLFQAIEREGNLLKCALRIPGGRNIFDTATLMSDAARIRELLPAHVKSVGPICAIEEIFEIEAF